MAKKTSKKDLDTKLDLGGLDDLDTDGMDFGELEDIDSSRDTSKGGVAKELIKESGKGFLDSLATNTAKKSLPESYTENYYELKDFADITKETFNKNISKVNKSIFKLGTEVKKILPFQVKALDSYLEKQKADFETFKQESEEAMRDSSIQSNLTSIFDKQLDITKAIEAKKDAENQVDRKERIVNTKLNLELLTSIESNTATQSAFTLQISKEYYKKSLELQFKSYFVQADMLKTMKDYYKGFGLQLEGIEKNTGLPEFIKLHKTERLAEILRDRSIESVTARAFDKNAYLGKVKDKLAKSVDTAISSVTNKIDAISDNLNMINSAGDAGGGSGLNILGSALSGVFGSSIGEKVSDKISPKIKEKIKNNKTINAGGNYLAMLANSPTTFFNSMREKVSKKKDQYSDESDPLRSMASKMYGGLGSLLSVTEVDKDKSEIKKASLLTHNKPAIFDQNVHRSITEVIPMFLSRILKENTDLSSMYKIVNSSSIGRFSGSETLTYDYEGRKLSTSTSIRKDIENNLLATDNSKSKINSLTNNMLSITNKNVLSSKADGYKNSSKLLTDKKTTSLLKDYFSKASRIEGVNFDYGNIIAKASKGEASIELQQLVDSNPKLKEILTLIETNKGKKDDLNYIKNSMSDVNSTYPITPVKELFRTASKIAGKKSYNNLKDDQAKIISKSFRAYIYNTNKDISVDSIVNGSVLRFFDNEELNKVETSLTIFINEVKSISLTNDIQRISSLELIIGVLNTSLRELKDVNPEVYQSIFDIYGSNVIDSGELDDDMIIRRSLTKGKERAPVDVERIRSITRASKSSVDESRNEIVTNSVMSSAGKYLNNLTNELKGSNSIFDTARIIARNSTLVVNSLRTYSNEKLTKVKKSIETLGKDLGNLTDETIKKSIGKYIFSVDSSITDIDKLILSETQFNEESIKELEQLKSTLSDTITDDSSITKLEKDIEKTKKYHKSKMMMLNGSRKALLTQSESLKKLQNDNSLSVTDFANKVKSILAETKQTLEQLINGSGEITQPA